MREPSLLGLKPGAVAGIKDYYETTMTDTNIVAGIDGRKSLFQAAVRGLRNHKVVWEDEFESDGYSCVIDGKKREFAEKHEDLVGKKFQLYEVEKDNYLLNMGLEQILGFLLKWEMNDNLIKFYADRGLAHETINYFRNNRKLDLTVEAIPEGIPIFGNEPYIYVEATFEQAQLPESLILGTWGLETGVATTASYYKNIIKEIGNPKIVLLEGGSRRIYPAAAVAASRAALAAGFNGTSLEAIVEYYPELMYKVGGSSGHSAVLHIGNDEQAFELQLSAYYGIKEGDSKDVIKEKIMQINRKGAGPTFLIDTFDSDIGLKSAIKLMKKYGIQCQIRNDSDNTVERLKSIRLNLDNEEISNAKIMISDDLKPWKVYNLLKNGAVIDLILVGTYLVNPYKLPGAAYKIAQDQPNIRSPNMEYRCKIVKNNPSKGTFPGPLDIYRIVGKDNKADRDLILLRGIDLIDTFMQKTDSGYIKLNQKVIEHGNLVCDIPDMCAIIENTAYHLDLLKEQHKKFRNATEYPVIISPTVIKTKETFAKNFYK